MDFSFFSYFRAATPSLADAGRLGMVSALDGWTAMPLLAKVQEYGWLKPLLEQDELRLTDLPGFHRQAVTDMFYYLASIALIKFVDESMEAVSIVPSGLAVLEELAQGNWKPELHHARLSGRPVNPVLVQYPYFQNPLTNRFRQLRTERLFKMVAGTYVTPILMGLTHFDLGTAWNNGENISIQRPPQAMNQDTFADMLRILEELDMAEFGEHRESVHLTPYGLAVWKQRHALAVPYSYRPYLPNYDQLFHAGDAQAHCIRADNVIGSGNTHGKVFELSKAAILSSTAQYAVDPGCGSGAFLIYVNQVRREAGLSELRLVGIDFEAAALEVAKLNLQAAEAENPVLLAGDIGDPAGIKAALQALGIDTKDCEFFSNFIAHEVTGRRNAITPEALFTAHRTHLGQGHGNHFSEVFTIPWQIAARPDVYPGTTNTAYDWWHRASRQGMHLQGRWQSAMAQAGFGRIDFKGIRRIPGTELYAHGLLSGYHP